MARRKIREFDAKTLLQDYLRTKGISMNWQGILVSRDMNLDALLPQHPWLKEPLAVKPDQLFGKRGQMNLVGLNLNLSQVKEFIQTHASATIAQATDALIYFLIEPFVPHTQEYHLSLVSQREGIELNFSVNGGINIENYWHTVKKSLIQTKDMICLEEIDALIHQAPPEHKSAIAAFIIAVFKCFQDLDFTYLEFNPFSIDEHGVQVLDTVAIVDDCASFLHKEEWSALAFPRSFGQKLFPEEEFIESIDKESGASLKLTILNPQGRIWNILSGGGASIIYLDTIANLGKQEEIANYGEYSGNPTTPESYQYAKTILDLMTREQHPQGKILIIGGAIANFTDVEKTFIGIIKALREYQEKLRAGKVSIFVRRGGPNYEKGLRLMRQAGKEMDIPMLVQGPDTPMIDIVGKAIEALQ